MNNYSPAYQRRVQGSAASPAADDRFVSRISALPEDPVVAMSYVPFQTDSSTYDEQRALKAGTLFPVLNKPFKGCGAV